MNALRVGIIGAGYWGEKLLRVFRGTDGAQVTVVCERDPRRRAAIGPGADVVDSTAELLGRADVDAVLVATPPSTHYALAREVLAAGKHCWVEKPLAMRVGDAQDLVHTARRKGLTLFVDETFLYDPLLQEAKRWIEAGRLGRIRHLSFQRLGMGRIRRDSDVWWNSAPHDLSILCYLVPGTPEHVSVVGFPYLQPGIADIAVGTVQLSGGVSAHVYVSWLSPLKVASTVVVGSEGMLHYEGRFGQRALRFFEYGVADPTTVTNNVVPIDNFAATQTLHGGAEEPLALAAHAFLMSVRTAQPAPSAGEYSQRVVELLAAGMPVA